MRWHPPSHPTPPRTRDTPLPPPIPPHLGGAAEPQLQHSPALLHAGALDGLDVLEFGQARGLERGEREAEPPTSTLITNLRAVTPPTPHPAPNPPSPPPPYLGLLARHLPDALGSDDQVHRDVPPLLGGGRQQKEDANLVVVVMVGIIPPEPVSPRLNLLRCVRGPGRKIPFPEGLGEGMVWGGGGGWYEVWSPAWGFFLAPKGCAALLVCRLLTPKGFCRHQALACTHRAWTSGGGRSPELPLNPQPLSAIGILCREVGRDAQLPLGEVMRGVLQDQQSPPRGILGLCPPWGTASDFQALETPHGVSPELSAAECPSEPGDRGREQTTAGWLCPRCHLRASWSALPKWCQGMLWVAACCPTVQG